MGGIYGVSVTVSYRLSVCEYVAAFFVDTGDLQGHQRWI